MKVMLTEEQMTTLKKLKGNEHNLTYSQRMILMRTERKISQNCQFQDNWVDYEESYGTDYNDCHGDYYDAEAEN